MEQVPTALLRQRIAQVFHGTFGQVELGTLGKELRFKVSNGQSDGRRNREEALVWRPLGIYLLYLLSFSSRAPQGGLEGPEAKRALLTPQSLVDLMHIRCPSFPPGHKVSLENGGEAYPRN